MTLTLEDFQQKRASLAVLGLGYVGLPLALHLAEHFDVLGFDIHPRRIEALRLGQDATGEVDAHQLRTSSLRLSCQSNDLARAKLFIVAVPTPVDGGKRPDLEPLRKACTLLGPHLGKGAVVVFESTVFPGVTEDFCGPLLEETSGLRCGSDFFLGYSPERINPGDRTHTLERVVKVVSGQQPWVCQLLAGIYGQVVKAGVFAAKDIRTAEAAKVIENTQRDLNIALMNELAIIFDHLGLDTQAVLAAARTKWNFLPFTPGLVGGHCIGVDPYYLTYAAEKAGYIPQVILAGRRINDDMGDFVVRRTIRAMVRAGVNLLSARTLVCGLTFKENVPDLRNSKVADILAGLREFGLNPTVHDPFADPDEALSEYGYPLCENALESGTYDAIILAVAHKDYAERSLDFWLSRLAHPAVLVDIKGILDPAGLPEGITYWRL
jgi:UDP-N-acetyl-D-galactosamine dehydrogenase